MFKKTEITVEAMVRQRNRILLGSLVGWGSWQATRIVREFTGGDKAFQAHWGNVLTDVFLVSWLVWVASLIYLVLYIKKLWSDPARAAMVGDELFQAHRLKAFTFAFFAVCIWQMMLPLAFLVHPFSAQIGSDITIFIAVTSCFASLLMLERNADAA